MCEKLTGEKKCENFLITCHELQSISNPGAYSYRKQNVLSPTHIKEVTTFCFNQRGRSLLNNTC